MELNTDEKINYIENDTKPKILNDTKPCNTSKDIFNTIGLDLTPSKAITLEKWLDKLFGMFQCYDYCINKLPNKKKLKYTPTCQLIDNLDWKNIDFDDDHVAFNILNPEWRKLIKTRIYNTDKIACKIILKIMDCYLRTDPKHIKGLKNIRKLMASYTADISDKDKKELEPFISIAMGKSLAFKNLDEYSNNETLYHMAQCILCIRSINSRLNKPMDSLLKSCHYSPLIGAFIGLIIGISNFDIPKFQENCDANVKLLEKINS